MNTARSIIAFADETLVQAGLQSLFETDPEFKLISVCNHRTRILRVAAEHQPDLILYTLAFDSDLSVVRKLRIVAPKSAIVLWSREFDSDLAHLAVEMGVRSLLSTTASLETVRECLRNSSGLAPANSSPSGEPANARHRLKHKQVLLHSSR